MARPKANTLTERELEVMHSLWPLAAGGGGKGDGTAEGVTVAVVRDELARHGRNLAHTTVATLLRILTDKGFVTQTGGERPFRYVPARSFEEVSGGLLGDLVERVFGGSRERLLVRLVEARRLSARERAVLEEVLERGDGGTGAGGTRDRQPGERR